MRLFYGLIASCLMMLCFNANAAQKYEMIYFELKPSHTAGALVGEVRLDGIGFSARLNNAVMVVVGQKFNPSKGKNEDVPGLFRITTPLLKNPRIFYSLNAAIAIKPSYPDEKDYFSKQVPNLVSDRAREAVESIGLICDGDEQNRFWSNTTIPHRKSANSVVTNVKLTGELDATYMCVKVKDDDNNNYNTTGAIDYSHCASSAWGDDGDDISKRSLSTCNLKDGTRRRAVEALCDSTQELASSNCREYIIPMLNVFYDRNPNIARPGRFNYNKPTGICRMCSSDTYLHDDVN